MKENTFENLLTICFVEPLTLAALVHWQSLPSYGYHEATRILTHYYKAARTIWQCGGFFLILTRLCNLPHGSLFDIPTESVDAECFMYMHWRQSNDGSSSRYVDLTRIGACFTTEFTRRGQVNPIKMHAMKLHSIPNPLGHRHQAPGHGVNGRWVWYGNHYGANLAMTGPQASHSVRSCIVHFPIYTYCSNMHLNTCMLLSA